ncbi:LOW QUALITY PROTEIN: cell adhesion molecule CEACAM19 [Rhynchonycteris naso]
MGLGVAKIEIPTKTQCHFSKDLLLSALVPAFWIPQGSWVALRIQKISEQQKNQNLLLSIQGIPDNFQDFIWYLGKETGGCIRLFTCIPDLELPQSLTWERQQCMGQRDIIGFPNGSMFLRHAQPSDSGTYHTEVTVNHFWTMRAKTKVQVARECWVLAWVWLSSGTSAGAVDQIIITRFLQCDGLGFLTTWQLENYMELPITHLPMNTGLVAAIIRSLAAASLFIGSIAYLLVTRVWKGQSQRKSSLNPKLGQVSPEFVHLNPAHSVLLLSVDKFGSLLDQKPWDGGLSSLPVGPNTTHHGAGSHGGGAQERRHGGEHKLNSKELLLMMEFQA